MSQRLQHLDADLHKRSLAELVSEEGPIHQAQIYLFKLLGTDMDELNLSVIAWHFRDRLMFSDAVDEASASILFIAANVWARLELVYFNFPLVLIRLGDSRLSVRNKRNLAARFSLLIHAISMSHVRFGCDGLCVAGIIFLSSVRRLRA